MRLAHIALVVGLIGSAACSTGSGSSPGATPAASPGTRADIDVNTLNLKKQAGEVNILVDVRTPREFASGHVEGAVNIPIDQLQARMAELEPHKDAGPVHVICQSGGRSARAATQLSGAGFDAVNVTGGTGQWIREGHPVAR